MPKTIEKKEPFKLGDIIYSPDGSKYKIVGLCEGLMAIRKEVYSNYLYNWGELEWRKRSIDYWFIKIEDIKNFK